MKNSVVIEKVLQSLVQRMDSFEQRISAMENTMSEKFLKIDEQFKNIDLTKFDDITVKSITIPGNYGSNINIDGYGFDLTNDDGSHISIHDQYISVRKNEDGDKGYDLIMTYDNIMLKYKDPESYETKEVRLTPSKTSFHKWDGTGYTYGKLSDTIEITPDEIKLGETDNFTTNITKNNISCKALTVDGKTVNGNSD